MALPDGVTARPLVERGASRSELATDSRTGALPLYQHVGMVVTQNWAHWVTDV